MKYCTVVVYRGNPLEWGGCVISESEGVETAEKKTKHGAHIIRKYEN